MASTSHPGSPEPERWRGIVPPGFLIGASCHTVDELAAAAQNERRGICPLRADLRPGLKAIHARASRNRRPLASSQMRHPIPVLALGGITASNTDACIEAGAQGIAGISLYQ